MLDNLIETQSQRSESPTGAALNISGDEAKFHIVGDWLEMPNGATYTLTFKP